MQLFMYLGGLRWSFYLSGSGTKPDEIADCGFANYGLQSIFVTTSPMHIFVFETLTGNLLYQYEEPTGNAVMYRGLETRLQSETGIFLGFQWFDGATAKNWMVMEMDQSTGESLWAMSFLNDGADTAITDLAYTGSLGTSEYQRLYAVGYDYTATTQTLKDHYIAYLDPTYSTDDGTKPTALANSVKWSTGDTGYIDDNTISHVYVQYLNLFACGEHDDARAATSQGLPWVLWSVITKNTDAFSVYKRWNFAADTGMHGWCSGLFSDGKHAYILLTSTEASTPQSTGTSAGEYGFSLVMKDIIYNTDHYLRHFNLEETTVTNLYIESFTVKTENNVKTHFVAGTTQNLFTTQGGAYSAATNMQNFIAKFTVDTTITTDVDAHTYSDGQFFCYTSGIFDADVDSQASTQMENSPSASDGWADEDLSGGFSMGDGFDFTESEQEFTLVSWMESTHQTACFSGTEVGYFIP
jgi:hypothetical protein